MKRITLNVDPAEARDLLDRVPRACLAFADGEGPHVEPVTLVCREGDYLVGMHPSAAADLEADQEAVLIIDDGVQFFDLRAIYVRGRCRPSDQLAGLADDFAWFAVTPTRTVAWDYARIRKVDDES